MVSPAAKPGKGHAPPGQAAVDADASAFCLARLGASKPGLLSSVVGSVLPGRPPAANRDLRLQP